MSKESSEKNTGIGSVESELDPQSVKPRNAEASLALQGRRLTAEQERLCLEYAADVLGDVRFQYWPRAFTAYNQQFKEGWIPHDYFSRVVVPRTKGAYAYLGMMSAVNPFLFGADFKLDLGAYAGGKFFDQRGRILSEDEFKQHLIGSAEQIVFKMDQSDRGRNVFFLKSDAVNIDFIKRIGMGVFQRKMTQHKSLTDIGSSAVATLRLTTVVEPDGTVSLRNSFLRLGRAAQTHVMEENIKVPIDGNGILGEESLNLSWEIRKEHPDSGFVYKGFKVPSFEKAAREAVRLHERIRFLSTIGWDFGIDENMEPQVLEFNSWSNGFIYGEAFSGPCFTGLGWESLWRG
jgi:hypothetical protein